MVKQIKISSLIELIHYVYSVDKLIELNTHILHQVKKKEGKINLLEVNLWKYILLYINTKKEKKHLSIEIINQTVLSKSRPNRRVEVVKNLIATIKQFLIHQYLEDDELLTEWLYWKSLKNTSIVESQNQLNLVGNKINIEQLSKASTLHQYLAFDFYKENYQLDCLTTSTPTNDNLRKSEYVLYLLNSQNQSEVNIEFHNRDTILNETRPEILTFDEDIDYAKLVDNIPKIAEDITGEDFVRISEDFLLDESITREKKVLLIGFLFNKSYRLFVDEGNQRPLIAFWKIYLGFGLQQKMFYNANYLNLQHYINVLSIVASIDKQSLNKYIQQYKDDLSPQEFPIGEQLGNAFSYYHNNKFKEVITALNKNINYGKRLDLKLRYHTFRVRSAYEIFVQNEQKNKKDFDRLCRSFKNYLKNKKKELNRIWERNDKFIDWIRLIAKQNSVIQLNAYKAEIEHKDIIHSDWLLKKINEKIGQM